MGQALIYIGAAMAGVWGVAHLVATRGVVAGFGDISVENRFIIAMEWIVEGVALVFLAVMAVTVAWVDSPGMVSTAVYVVTAGCLTTLAVVSFFTGFRVRFLPFRLCPFVLATSAALIFLGGIVF